MPRPVAPLILVLAGCDAGPRTLSTGGSNAGGSGGDTATDAPGDVLPGRLATWVRDEIATPGPARFNEILYDSVTQPSLEWVELYNPLALDLDVSGWSLAGAVEFEFPGGTLIAAGSFLVVAADPALVPGALGPYTGRLDGGGERLDLYNNAGRRIDSIAYGTDDPWPVAPDGTGVSLAKIRADSASDRAENWTSSSAPGGTPGAPNDADPDAPPTIVELVPLGASWAYDLSGEYPAEDWASPDYDDGAWARGDAVFYAGGAVAGAVATVRITADNYYALYLGDGSASDLRLLAEDADGLWYTVDSWEVDVGPLDHLYMAAWEAPWDYGGPQMAIAEAETEDGIVGTNAADWEWVLGPSDGCPGATPPDPAPTADDIADLVADAEASGAWELPAVEADRASDPWGWATASSFDAGTRYVWADTFSDTSITNTENTYVLLRSRAAILGDRGATELGSIPTTATFRTTFTFDGDPAAASLLLTCQLDDGAVAYLNGTEIFRGNLPGGSLDADTLASAAVSDAVTLTEDVSADALVRGDNVLAVELHQASRADDDLTFGCGLTATVAAASEYRAVRFSEIAPTSESPYWIELANVADRAESLDGLVVASTGGGERVLAAGSLAPGESTVLDDLGFDVEAGDVLSLWSADRGRLLDAVRANGSLRGRTPGGGPWRTPTAATPGEQNLVDVHEDVVINEIMYHHASVSREGEPVVEVPEEWVELYNRGSETVDLGGWQLVDAVAYTIPAGISLAPGAYLVIASDAATLQAIHPDVAVIGDFDDRLGNETDRVLLLDARGNPADEVRYYDGGRWPDAADGGGSSLELRDPDADNGTAEAWAASDEAARTAWSTYTWSGMANPSVVGPDGTWQEFVMGLLGRGEILLDDLRVIEDPAGSAIEVVQDGDFDDGDARWRLLGTHRHSEVVPDPDDPANPVLRLVATGATGHMHNHAETTLLRPISTREYQVSFRARWVSGSNQLNTRLYFNRLPRTWRIERPETSGTPGAVNSTRLENLGPTFSKLRTDVAVPAAFQPVVVRVDLADRDGIASVVLHSAVDGGEFTSTPMEESAAGTWQGSLDGQGAGSIVQFYVEATDSLGASSTFPADGPDSRALVTFDDGRAATNGLHNLRILLTPADSDWMHADVNLMSDDMLGATVIADESIVYWDVGVRAKGSERGRPVDPRIGYALRFHADEGFRGTQGTVHIDRSEGVGYGQREMLMNLAMTGAGSVSGEYNDLVRAITPLAKHTGPAELMLDRATSLVLANQFEDGDAGSMFEYELVYYPYTTVDGTAEGLKLPQPDGVVGNAITDLGDDPEAWRWTFLLGSNEEVDDYLPMMDLGGVFSQSTDAFLEDVESVIDVDQWLRGFAFATLSGAVDNYGGDGSWHNARFYLRPQDGRFLYFPHDLDFIFGPTGAVVGNGDLSRLLQNPEYLRGYYGHLQDIVARAYNEAYLGPWCDRMGELTGQNFASHCQFVQDRADWIMYGASDAVMTRFPAREFRITTEDGVEVVGGAVTIEGEAWVDVRWMLVAGTSEPLAVTWLDEVRWRVTVPVEEGQGDVTLLGVDLRGGEVGRDSVEIEGG